MSTFGYIRVSQATEEGANLETQRRAIQDQCGYIFEDAASSQTMERPGLGAMMAALKAGDVLVVYDQDRLGRHPEEVVALIRELDDMGVTVKTRGGQILTMSTPEASLQTRVKSAVDRYAYDRMLVSSREGQRRAHEQGKQVGARYSVTREQAEHIQRLLADHLPSEVSKMTGVPVYTIRRARKWNLDEIKADAWAKS